MLANERTNQPTCPITVLVLYTDPDSKLAGTVDNFAASE